MGIEHLLHPCCPNFQPRIVVPGRHFCGHQISDCRHHVASFTAPAVEGDARQWTIKTGLETWWTIECETLPIRKRSSPWRPWVDTTIRSIPSACAATVAAACPVATHVLTL